MVHFWQGDSQMEVVWVQNGFQEWLIWCTDGHPGLLVNVVWMLRILRKTAETCVSKRIPDTVIAHRHPVFCLLLLRISQLSTDHWWTRCHIWNWGWPPPIMPTSPEPLAFLVWDSMLSESKPYFNISLSSEGKVHHQKQRNKPNSKFPVLVEKFLRRVWSISSIWEKTGNDILESCLCLTLLHGCSKLIFLKDMVRMGKGFSVESNIEGEWQGEPQTK